MVAELNFQHVYDGDSFRLHGATCVWWDEHAVGWATDGCRLVLTSPTHTVCHCNHLANMAVMMDVEGPLEKPGVQHKFLVYKLLFIFERKVKLGEYTVSALGFG